MTHRARLVLLLLCAVSPLSAADRLAADRTDAVFSSPATAQEAARIAARATQRLATSQVVRGEFVQRRFLRELPKPLTSSGDFLFARDTGIAWSTREPFGSELVLTPAGVLQRDDSGGTLHLETQRQPALRVVARVFLALFSLDLELLATDFTIFAEQRGDRWAIGLRPRHSTLAAVLRDAVVAGGAAVESVTLTDTEGERTAITLQALRHESTPLSAAERARF